MASCLDNIVSLGVCPDESESTSGFKLIQAAGISPINLAKIATEQYGNGVDLAMAKKELAIIQVKNDFIGALQANNVVANISNIVYDTSVFNTSREIPAAVLNRGVVLHKSKAYRGKLRKTLINAVQVYPLLTTGTGKLTIIDGSTLYEWDVELVPNQVNTFSKAQLSGFPFEVQSDDVKIMFDGTDTTFAGSDIICGKGCNGNAPNPCGWADGWSGTNQVKTEGYGVNVQFVCECDYSKILCELSTSFSGELIWLKWQILIFEEQVMSNRFNDWIIYNQEEINTTVLPNLRNAYNAKWNTLMQGMTSILNGYKDECLNCRGIRWAVTV